MNNANATKELNGSFFRGFLARKVGDPISPSYGLNSRN